MLSARGRGSILSNFKFGKVKNYSYICIEVLADVWEMEQEIRNEINLADSN